MYNTILRVLACVLAASYVGPIIVGGSRAPQIGKCKIVMHIVVE